MVREIRKDTGHVRSAQAQRDDGRVTETRHFLVRLSAEETTARAPCFRLLPLPKAEPACGQTVPSTEATDPYP